MTRARTIATAGLALYINGKRYGWVTSFEFASQTPKRPIMALDRLDPYELVSIATKVVGKMGVVRTIGDGGLERQGLTTQFENLPREKYFSIMIVEGLSDTVIFSANHCSVTSQSWSMGSKSIVTGSVDFEALDWNNEAAK